MGDQDDNQTPERPGGGGQPTEGAAVVIIPRGLLAVAAAAAAGGFVGAVAGGMVGDSDDERSGTLTLPMESNDSDYRLALNMDSAAGMADFENLLNKARRET